MTCASGRPPWRSPPPRSRAWRPGCGDVESYPTLELALGPAEVALAGGLVVLGAAPLVGRSARLGVARA